MASRLALDDKGILGLMRLALEGIDPMPLRAAMCAHIPTVANGETIRILGAVPGMREWIGPRTAKGLRTDSITVSLKKYETTVDVDAADLFYDKTGQVQEALGDLAKRAEEKWLGLIMDMVLYSIDDTKGTCISGQYLVDTDHVIGGSGTINNDLTSSEVGALNVGTANDWTADEAAKAIIGMINYMATFKDDQGEPCNESARDFLVLTPMNLYGAAKQAVSQNMLNTGAGTYDNPLKAFDWNIDVTGSPRLTDDDFFWVVRKDSRAKPLVSMARGGDDYMLKGTTSDYYFDNDAVQAGVKAERGMAYGDPRAIAGGLLS